MVQFRFASGRQTLDYGIYLIMESLLAHLSLLELDHCREDLERLVRARRAFLDSAGGNFGKFRRVVDLMRPHVPSRIVLTDRAVTIGQASDLTPDESQILRESLARLSPWRKGPFDLFGIRIDSEWQSWMKWDRLLPHLADLQGRRILDIGSSNGYYMFRASAREPRMVLGLEPQSQFYSQYLAVQKYLRQDKVFCLPIAHEDLPDMGRFFDTAFCMGVLYHRPSPVDMLKKIAASLRRGGELIAETLVLEGQGHRCLFPRDRYAKMRNVYFIPDLAVMTSWLERAGFIRIRCVDVTRTTLNEQRRTPWIQTESLADFLDPKHPEQTVEGYPAPVRAVFLAEAS